jgi:hypothetical protein
MSLSVNRLVSIRALATLKAGIPRVLAVVSAYSANRYPNPISVSI